MEKLNNGRAVITSEGNITKLKIPVKRNNLLVFFFTVWLFLWFSFFTSLSSSFGLYTDEGIDYLLLFWLFSWILGGMAILGFVLWNLFGKEEINISSRYLELKRSLFGLGRKRQYDIKNVLNFRFNEISGNIFSLKARMAFWGMGEGKIKFDYGMKSPSFGLGLEDAEANYIIKLIREKLPVSNSSAIIS